MDNIPAFKPYEGQSAERIVADHKAGKTDVYYVRAGSSFLRGGKKSALPATTLYVKDGVYLFAGDKYSVSGNKFDKTGKPMIKSVENVYLVIVPKGQAPVAASPDGVMTSDYPGIAAYKPAPKAAPPAPAPKPVKSAAGLLTLHNPDRPTIWGERVA